MKIILASIALAAMTLAVAPSAGGVLARGYSAVEEAVTIGVDVEPAGNTATSLGPIDPCVSVSSGDTFQVDIFITNVTNLLAWEAYFTYDTKAIKIVERDVMMFQAANAGSQVFDVSEGLPDIDGWYRVATADIAEPPATDSGSGVLARLTLEALTPGISPLSLSPVDVNDDGRMDLGPSLKDFHGESIDDRDGDGFFDGPIANAQIAVDTLCPGVTPVATPTTAPASPSPVASTTPVVETPVISPTPETPGVATPTETPTPQLASPTVPSSNSTEDEGSAWTGSPAIIGYVLGGLAALLVAGVALIGIGRRRAG